ncbi:DUF2079 domain-containing protein [Jatrophihabitans sp.]|jgi:uncharacterized membrane protein|uniref:DUF2079 domain-containing protein n=1 Tax=Jatrophihabitans sp. TaxID=1932789 RepID=UPI002F13D6E6
MTTLTAVTRSARARVAGHWQVSLLTGLLFAVYGGYGLIRHATYLTAGYDLGIFDQAVRNYARFRAPHVPLKGTDYNILADHFHPIIALAAPLYWIWNSPCVLLLLQMALIAASVPVVYSFALRRMPRGGALVVAGAYGLGWAIQAMVDFDFHEVAWGLPILAVAVDALDRRDDRTLLISAGLLLLVREDMGAVLVMIGLLRLAYRPRRTGYLLIGGGIAGYLLVTGLIIPAFAPNGQFAYWTFDALGPDLPHALLTILAHPLHTVRLFFTPAIKAETLAYFFLPLALLPLRSRYCLIAVPLLAERFFNSRDHVWTTHFHYNALPWLVLVLAMVDGGARLGVWNRPRLNRVMLAWLVIVPVYLCTVPTITAPAIRRMLTGSAWRMDAHLRDQQAAVRQVPADVCVSVDDRLATHLTSTNRVTLPGIPTPRTDFVVLDMGQAQVGYPLDSPQQVLADSRAAGFVQVFSQGDLLVLRSPGYTGPSDLCRP